MILVYVEQGVSQSDGLSVRATTGRRVPAREGWGPRLKGWVWAGEAMHGSNTSFPGLVGKGLIFSWGPTKRRVAEMRHLNG